MASAFIIPPNRLTRMVARPQSVVVAESVQVTPCPRSRTPSPSRWRDRTSHRRRELKAYVAPRRSTARHDEAAVRAAALPFGTERAPAPDRRIVQQSTDGENPGCGGGGWPGRRNPLGNPSLRVGRRAEDDTCMQIVGVRPAEDRAVGPK